MTVGDARVFRSHLHGQVILFGEIVHSYIPIYLVVTRSRAV
jgi:hypothetical protein